MFIVHAHLLEETLLGVRGYSVCERLNGAMKRHCVVVLACQGRGSNFGETDCCVLFRTVPHLWSSSGTQLSPVAPSSG